MQIKLMPIFGLERACLVREDYTGCGRPGVWHLEPVSDDFKLQVRRRGPMNLDVTRVQFSLAPSKAGTYNNQQGKTVRTPRGEPLGHCIDFSKPEYFTEDEYTQHVYMILGRAQRLSWSLFRNLPQAEDGDVDFAVFENGPPDYISSFLRTLEVGACRSLCCFVVVVFVVSLFL